jgi:hypothetical protein
MTRAARADRLLAALRRQVRRIGHADWDREVMAVLEPSGAGPDRFLFDYLDRFIDLQRAFRGQDPLAPLRPCCGGMERLSALAVDGASAPLRRLPDRRNFVIALETMRASFRAQLGPQT